MKFQSGIWVSLLIWVAHGAFGADPVFSGPQPGEKATPFKVIELGGSSPGGERNPVDENKGDATAWVFVHGIERSIVPLLRVVDAYGALRRDKIKTEFVFLSGDRLEGEQRVRAAANSLKLNGRIGLSMDGAEGPGNYGLNKDCLMTIITAKDNVVESNFALLQPGIADAPKILEALAKVCGDNNPPDVAALTERKAERPDARPMARERAGAGDRVEGIDARRPEATRPADKFPGAVPTDPTLNSLIRRVIRPGTDNAAVDGIIAEMATHIHEKPELEKQAIDMWVRVLHFGDHYGTEHAREAGKAFMKKLEEKAK